MTARLTISLKLLITKYQTKPTGFYTYELLIYQTLKKPKTKLASINCKSLKHSLFLTPNYEKRWQAG